MRKTLLIAACCLLPGLASADNHGSSIVEMWKCELKDGKTLEEVNANNEKWLALTRKEAGTDEVHSYSMQAIVGSLDKFLFADIYPDMAVWAAAKAAEQTEEGKAIEAAFEELMECTENRLYKSTGN